jgi:hypothetical protein
MIATVGDLKKELEKYPDDMKLGINIRGICINVALNYVKKATKFISHCYSSWKYMEENIPKNDEDVVLLFPCETYTEIYKKYG